jgi:hypothetical protein
VSQVGENKWIAQYHDKDDTNEKVIKLGIRQEKHLTWIYFDFDSNDSDLCASTEEKAKDIIKEQWGYMETFEWIKADFIN